MYNLPTVACILHCTMIWRRNSISGEKARLAKGFESTDQLPTTNPWRTNEMNEINSLPAERMIMMTDGRAEETVCRVHPGQKWMVWMKEGNCKLPRQDILWLLLVQTCSLMLKYEIFYKSTDGVQDVKWTRRIQESFSSWSYELLPLLIHDNYVSLHESDIKSTANGLESTL